jgi:hypothetical protein
VSDKQTVLSAPFPLKFPEYLLFPKSTNLLNISGIIDWIHTMIREYIARLKTRVKGIAKVKRTLRDGGTPPPRITGSKEDGESE